MQARIPVSLSGATLLLPCVAWSCVFLLLLPLFVSLHGGCCFGSGCRDSPNRGHVATRCSGGGSVAFLPSKREVDTGQHQFAGKAMSSTSMSSPFGCSSPGIASGVFGPNDPRWWAAHYDNPAVSSSWGAFCQAGAGGGTFTMIVADGVPACGRTDLSTTIDFPGGDTPAGFQCGTC
jgi:hypothetical protein